MPLTAVSGVSGGQPSLGALPSPEASLAIPAGATSSAEAIALFGSMAIAEIQTEAARHKIDDAHQKRQKQIDAARRAIEEAKKASEKGGFWEEVGAVAKQVGTYAAIAAAVGGAAATGGSSLVVAAALIGIGTSIAGQQMQKAGVDAKLCTIEGLDIHASDVVILGGALAATAMGASAGPGDLNQKWLITAGHYTVTGACGVQAGTSGTQAVAAERTGHYDAQVAELAADQRNHENKAAHQQHALLAAIDLIRSSREVRERALGAVGSILETRRSIDMAIVGRKA